MKLMVICAWCGKYIRFKDANSDRPPKNPISHSICAECKDKLEEELTHLKGGDHETEYQRGVA